MNTAQAKKIPLSEILARLGFQPIKTFRGGEELAFLSPFRAEKEPSLFVNIRINCWNDFGDIGGNALDFVIRYRNTDVKGGLEFLDQMFGKGFTALPTTEKTVPVAKTPKEEVFLLVSALPFGSSAKSLVKYITEERRIDPEIAAKYLKELHFTHRETGKKYFAAGFENLSGGYEIRNPFFKSSLGAKDMSFISGSGAGEALYVFEGFLDFLSKLTLDHSKVPTADCLILNSVSYFEKAVYFVRKKGYEMVKGFLDNDRAGNDTTFKLRAEYKNTFFDQRYEYQEFKDLNEYLKYPNAHLGI